MGLQQQRLHLQHQQRQQRRPSCGSARAAAAAMRGEDCADKPRGHEALVDGERRGLHRTFRLWERSHRPAMNEDLRGFGAETAVCVSFAWLPLGMPERPEPPPPAVTSDPLMLYRQVGWT